MSAPAARFGPVVAGLALAAVAAGRLAPTCRGWHHEDDVRSLRWVLEYRDQPWVALTELHSLHDHIRPLTLITTWAGAQLSNGAWWGVHLVHIALCCLALAGVVALGTRLGRSPWAGLAAGFLVVAQPGFGSMPTWNAWICSAGELACGLWALVALQRALDGRRWPWLALVLMVLAGLFKEPGWLVYPLVGAVLVLQQWWQTRQRRDLAGLLSLPIGAAGLALTWHPTNVFRAEVAELPLATSLQTFLSGAVVGIADRWPVDLVDLEGAGLGVPILLVGLALGVALAGEGLGGLVIGLGLAIASLLLPTWASTLLLLVAGGLAFVRRPRPELVLLLVPCAIMAPFPGTNAVQLVAAGVGLSLLAGAAVVSLARHAPRWAPPLLALLVLAPTARLVSRDQGLAARGLPEGEQLARDAFLGVGGVASRLGSPELASGGPLGALVLAPMLGLRILDGAPVWPIGVELPGPLWLPASPGAPDWSVDNLLRELPPLLGSFEPKMRPGRKLSQRPDIDGLLLDLDPGLYLLGLSLGMASEEGLVLLEARDRCGGAWSVAGPTRQDALAVGAAVRVAEDCGPLSVTRARPDLPGLPFLVPLRGGREDLRGAHLDTRIVDIGIAEDGVVPGLMPEGSRPAPKPQAPRLR